MTTLVLSKDTMKKCLDCRKILHVDSFYKRNRGGRRSTCKACWAIREKERRINRTAEQKEQRDKTVKKYALKVNYGLSYDEYLNLLESQSYKCKICTIDLERPYVDHCHESGQVRGVLCQHCNSGLGMFKDNPDTLRRGAEYLESCSL